MRPSGLFLLFAFSLPVLADAKPCGLEENLGYCFQESATPNDFLLVFLPGVLNSETRIFSRYFLLEHLQKTKRAVPHLLSLGFGRVNFLADQPEQPISSMVKTVARLVERMRRRSGARRVLLLGDSMGGFNALQILLREPSSFDRVALICPALSGSSPFSSEWNADPDTQRASRFYRYAYARALRWSFGSEENWLRSGPFGYLESASFLGALPPVYLASLQADTYGFVDAVAAAARLLGKAGFPVTESSEPGGKHCFPDAERLAHFLFDLG
jgi:pimeloyl-ACP methyl ester carboxylesterase